MTQRASAIPAWSGHLLIVDFQGGEEQPLQGAGNVGGLGVAGGEAQGFLGLALLQEPPQQAGQHGLALRQGVEAGVLSMGI